MTGLIWLIQLVHYPLFEIVESKNFDDIHRFHTRNITWIVAPIMTLELLSGIALCIYGDFFWMFNFGGIIFLWFSTGLISVPLHNKLAKGFDLKNARKLTLTNWIRTFIWSARSVGILVYLIRNMTFNL